MERGGVGRVGGILGERRETRPFLRELRLPRLPTHLPARWPARSLQCLIRSAARSRSMGNTAHEQEAKPVRELSECQRAKDAHERCGQRALQQLVALSHRAREESTIHVLPRSAPKMPTNSRAAREPCNGY